MSQPQRNRIFSFQDDHQSRYRWLLATPVSRMAASAADALLTLLAAAPAGWLLYARFGKAAWPPDWAAWGAYLTASPALMAASALCLLYFAAQVVLLARCGQSFGKRLAGIRIVRTDGKAAGWVHAWVLRSLVFVLLWVAVAGTVLRLLGLDDNFNPYELLWIPYVFNFAMLYNLHDNNRTLQDKLAGTAVVEEKMRRE